MWWKEEQQAVTADVGCRRRLLLDASFVDEIGDFRASLVEARPARDLAFAVVFGLAAPESPAKQCKGNLVAVSKAVASP